MNVSRRQPLEAALCVILVSIVAVTFAQVVSRYLLRASLPWSEELARFLLMWLAALSSAYAFKVRSHFALHFVVDHFDGRTRQAIGTLVTALVSLFLIVFAWESAKFTLAVRDQIAPGTRMSMAIPYSSALAGSVLMLYYVVKNWWTEAGLTPTHKANESEEQGKQGLDSGSAASSETGV
jgi:TRAP-type C4-dicarboxylate transport system permease small subunit